MNASKTFDLHIEGFVPLIPPSALKTELPVSDTACKTVTEARHQIQGILTKKDPRMLVVAGPCSIHDEKAALEYGKKLNELRKKVDDAFFIVMRVYFEKPRTNVGWKGLINDPRLDDSYDMESGLRRARRLLMDLNEMGMPTATEMLDPITPQYIAGLICWSAIGARTTESQTHREMASGLSMPVGFKNSTDGDLNSALNAMTAAGSPQRFLGIDPQGQTCIVRTTGNPYTHIVLRGGKNPNYDNASIMEANTMLKNKGLLQSVIVDCSHDNSRKKHEMQCVVWQDVINQRMDGNSNIIGLMIESNLYEGNQKNSGDLSTLKYGVSITDACISWETTEKLITDAHKQFTAHINEKP